MAVDKEGERFKRMWEELTHWIFYNRLDLIKKRIIIKKIERIVKESFEEVKQPGDYEEGEE